MSRILIALNCTLFSFYKKGWSTNGIMVKNRADESAIATCPMEGIEREEPDIFAGLLAGSVARRRAAVAAASATTVARNGAVADAALYVGNRRVRYRLYDLRPDRR